MIDVAKAAQLIKSHLPVFKSEKIAIDKAVGLLSATLPAKSVFLDTWRITEEKPKSDSSGWETFGAGCGGDFLKWHPEGGDLQHRVFLVPRAKVTLKYGIWILPALFGPAQQDASGISQRCRRRMG